MRSINEFCKVIENIAFKYNHFLLIDGLDVRPREIDAKEYGECIGALVRAVYDINTKILGNMNRKDKNDFKIIALTRTDIFLNSELVNVTSCIMIIVWNLIGHMEMREISYIPIYIK